MSAETNRRIAALCALPCVAGCAVVYEGRYGWDEGWRIARVIRYVDATAAAPTASRDCRKEASSDQLARRQYAEVAYQTEGRWLRQRVVPIPPGATVKEGQTVYINVGTCGNLVMASVRS